MEGSVEVITEAIKTVAWTVLFLSAIQGIVVYSVVKVLHLGRPLIDRKPQPVEEIGRIHRIGGN